MRWQGTGYYPGDAVCIGPPDRMISWVVCNHQCCVYLAVDAMEFLTGSSDRRDNEAGPVASASNLTAYRVHACQKVSVQSRCLSVGDGSNGMWRGGSGVLASLEPIGIRKASVDELHAQLIILHTISWIPELHQAVINKRVASMHIVAERLHFSILLLPGTRLNEKHRQSPSVQFNRIA
jgi:hypothetical protein